MLVGALIPLVRIFLLVETKLIAFRPLASVLSVPMPILVGDEITAHALIQGTAVEGLGRPGDTILAAVNGRTLTLAIDVIEEDVLHLSIAIDVIEEDVLHLSKLTSGDEGSKITLHSTNSEQGGSVNDPSYP